MSRLLVSLNKQFSMSRRLKAWVSGNKLVNMVSTEGRSYQNVRSNYLD